MPELVYKNGCTRVAFGDVVKLSRVRSDDLQKDGFERYVGLEHLEPGDLKIRRWGSIAAGTTFTSVFRSGQVLFGKRRAYQRKVAVADFDGVCSGDIYVFEPKDKHLLPELLPFICQTDGFFEHAVGTSAGSLSPRTNWNSLASYEFPLPSPEEQRRVAEVLWAVESSLDRLQSAADCATRMIQAMLLEMLPPVSRGGGRWPVARLGDIAEVIDPNPSHRYPEYVDDGIPLIATQDFVGDYGFGFEKCKRVSGQVFEEQRARCRFAADDVVFARKGILGLARPYGVEKKAFSHTIVTLKAKPSVADPGFLLWLARTETFIAQIQRYMNSNSGVPTLGVKTLQGLKVWRPDLNAQQEIATTTSAVEDARRSMISRREALRDQKLRVLAALMAPEG